MKPGDIIFNEDPISGRHTFYEIEAVALGGVGLQARRARRDAHQGQSRIYFADLFGMWSRRQSKPRKPSGLCLSPLRLPSPCRSQRSHKHLAPEHGVYACGGPYVRPDETRTSTRHR
jgi:hypothetical protein